MLLGSACPEVTESLAKVVPYWNIIQVKLCVDKQLNLPTDSFLSFSPQGVIRYNGSSTKRSGRVSEFFSYCESRLISQPCQNSVY